MKIREVSRPMQVLADLLNTELSLTQIGAARGVSAQRVHQIYEDAVRAGIVVRRRTVGRPRKEVANVG